MEKTDFDKLLDRYVTGDVSEAERIKIEAWLDVMKAEKGNDLRLSKEDEDTLFQKIKSNSGNLDEIISFRPENYRPRSFFRKHRLRIAATFLLVAVASYVIFNLANRSQPVFERTATAGTERLVLDDGSIVWLTQGSKLTYQEKSRPDTRYAALEGEGFFEVAKNPDMPFMVVCGSMTVKVVGTSFNVKTGPGHVELEVLTGRVNLSSTADTMGVDVSPMEKVVYSKDGTVERFTLAEADVQTIIESTDYDMRFSNTTMDNVFARIEKKFATRVVVEDTVVNRCRMTADFTDQSLAKTMSMIAELLDIEYSIGRDKVTVTGSGCQ